MESKGLLKSTLHVTLLSFGGIILGFVSQLLIAFFFGAGDQRDAYFGAIVVPTYIIAVFLGSIGAVFLSQYINLATNISVDRSIRFFNNLLACCFLLLISLMALIMIFAQEIIDITVPGFTGAQSQMASIMLRILAPTIIFQSLTNIFGSVMQSKHKFILPAIPALIIPVVTLIFVFASEKAIGIMSLAWGNLVGNALAFAVISIYLVRTKEIRLSFNKHIFDEDVKKIFGIAAPLLIAGTFYRFSGVWERMLASKLTVGSISYLGYSNQLLIVFSTLTSGGISTIFFPVLSRAWSSQDMIALRQNFKKALLLLLYVTVPATFLFCYMRVEFIQILFERGAFDHNSTIAVGGTLALLMGAFIFQSLGSIITRSFYFMEMTVVVSLIGVIEIVLYILMSMILVRHFAFYGLAFSFSFAAMINVVISSIVVNKKIGFLTKQLWNDLFKILLSCLIALALLRFVKLPFINLYANTICSSFLFVFIYVFLTYFLKLEAILNAKNEIFKYLKKS